MKFLKIFGTTLGIITLILLLTVGSYVLYVVIQYDRIPDNTKINVENNNNNNIEIDKDLTYTSYNIGFGAYSKDFTFFMDSGYDENGNLLHGHYGKAISKDDVIKNTNGAINVIKNLNSDFVALQEVDIKANRSYNVDQKEMIYNSFKDNYNSTFALNFHSAYLAYPLHDPHGASTAGINTLSKYKVIESVRKSYTVSTKFPDKYMDLDRCFLVNRYDVTNGKQLVLINSHMSAYDEGGTIRHTQAKELTDYINNEYKKGNYVIVGGDFNHDLLTYNSLYNYNDTNIPFDRNIKRPEWVFNIFNKDGKTIVDEGFKIIAADNLPSCRGCERPYTDTSFVTTVDGFIISDNVELIDVKTSYDLDNTLFNYSDHMPTTLKFKLK